MADGFDLADVAAAEIDALFPSMPDNARRELLIAGLLAFHRDRFQGASTRALAKSAGLSSAALYVHFESKAALLFEIARAGHQSVLDAVTAATRAAGGDARRQILTFVEAFTRWHAEHAAVARIIQYEFEALRGQHRAQIVRLRREVENVLRAALLAGMKDGSIAIDDPDTTRRALLSLSIDAVRWFRASGRITPAELGREYAALADRLISR